MPTPFLARAVSALRRFFGRPPSAEDAHRDNNRLYFSGMHQQERMLADRPRMDFYHTAIERHIHPGDHVIDLGTGTGILAAFASRRGAARVHALDHSPILKHARSLAVDNEIKNVDFISGHSSKFTLDKPVDVILHEQMGDYLFDEAMIPNVCDLRDRLLKPGGRILPACFEFYCEPVQLDTTRHVPFIWNLNVKGYDFSSMERQRPQDTDYYRLCGNDGTLVEHFLAEPAPALTFDLHTVNEATLPKDLRIQKTVTSPGRIDGLVVYFRTTVDDDLQLSSAPHDPGRAPHWGFRILRTEPADYALGDVIEVSLTVARWHDVDTWRWAHAPAAVSVSTEPALV
ncbi:methyltransferase domain-containing protein [Rariglobus hedericola]|uniref:Methyltransferase domain-containing protein n=1 Tax=Rariglobus hedericola TaxID=2597822 RepID=A0A556QRJ0_9BACT|nr:methyltransferase domain-containing protein [Rariglobus hedericola]TSJ79251.1 methyltransferase domain-containing protein [Rariglobus hedericola]